MKSKFYNEFKQALKDLEAYLFQSPDYTFFGEMHFHFIYFKKSHNTTLIISSSVRSMRCKKWLY